MPMVFDDATISAVKVLKNAQRNADSSWAIVSVAAVDHLLKVFDALTEARPDETLCEAYPLTLKPQADPNHDDGEHWVLDAETAYLFRIHGSRGRAVEVVEVLNAHAASLALAANIKRVNRAPSATPTHRTYEAADAAFAKIAPAMEVIQAAGRGQRQLDDDGVEVGVSRQALHEILDGLKALADARNEGKL